MQHNTTTQAIDLWTQDACAEQAPAAIKIIGFWQKYALTRGFYGSPPPPTSLNSDRRVRREGVWWAQIGLKKVLIIFDLYSIDIDYNHHI